MVYAIEDLENIAKKVIEEAKSRTIWVFEGEMGAGKTSLVNKIMSSLGCPSESSSPTFALINEYSPPAALWEDKTIYHMDLYRLVSLQEALDICIEDYLYSGHLCLIEWPEIIQNLLKPSEYNLIEIKILSESKRSYKFTQPI